MRVRRELDVTNIDDVRALLEVVVPCARREIDDRSRGYHGGRALQRRLLVGLREFGLRGARATALRSARARPGARGLARRRGTRRLIAQSRRPGDHRRQLRRGLEEREGARVVPHAIGRLGGTSHPLERIGRLAARPQGTRRRERPPNVFVVVVRRRQYCRDGAHRSSIIVREQRRRAQAPRVRVRDRRVPVDTRRAHRARDRCRAPHNSPDAHSNRRTRRGGGSSPPSPLCPCGSCTPTSP